MVLKIRIGNGVRVSFLFARSDGDYIRPDLLDEFVRRHRVDDQKLNPMAEFFPVIHRPCPVRLSPCSKA
jgi:hypothetical protein